MLNIYVHLALWFCRKSPTWVNCFGIRQSLILDDNGPLVVWRERLCLRCSLSSWSLFLEKWESVEVLSLSSVTSFVVPIVPFTIVFIIDGDILYGNLGSILGLM
ncbi:hypothetical protein P8452_65061 [Trifolium repens]|nr:hypothetical protein QL285_086465 [Trifolium repens]WJX82280.1 hypothetical protein P8452_65061 [Trifolium repens]